MKKKTLLFVTIFPLVAVVAYAAVGLLLFMNRDNANAIDTTNKVAVYTVTFDTRGGSAVEAMQITSGQKIDNEPIPSKTDYRFLGWYTDIGYTNLFDFQTEIENDLTLYAKWVEIYTVNFESCSGSAVDLVRVTNGQTIKMPTTTRDNYVFLGWYLDADYTQRFDFATPITGNTTLYAQWARDISEYCTIVTMDDMDNEYAVIEGYSGDCTELAIIPSTYDGVPVTLIRENAFKKSTLTAIVIPENIKTIEEYAFLDANNLTIIYCEIAKPSDAADDWIPDGWDVDWKIHCDAEVEWGYQINK